VQRLTERPSSMSSWQQREAVAQAERLGEQGGLSIEGHPLKEYNGFYRLVVSVVHGRSYGPN